MSTARIAAITVIGVEMTRHPFTRLPALPPLPLLATLASPRHPCLPAPRCRSKQNEDRYQLEVAEGGVEEGVPEVYAAVFDGHGGAATAEWLTNNLLGYVEKYWQGTNAPEKAVSEAFIQADKVGRGRLG